MKQIDDGADNTENADNIINDDIAIIDKDNEYLVPQRQIPHLLHELPQFRDITHPIKPQSFRVSNMKMDKEENEKDLYYFDANDPEKYNVLKQYHTELHIPKSIFYRKMLGLKSMTNNNINNEILSAKEAMFKRIPTLEQESRYMLEPYNNKNVSSEIIQKSMDATQDLAAAISASHSFFPLPIIIPTFKSNESAITIDIPLRGGLYGKYLRDRVTNEIIQHRYVIPSNGYVSFQQKLNSQLSQLQDKDTKSKNNNESN